MQPQPTPALNSVPQLPLNAVTTEQIQKCLDDNKNLILAILENQNLGKLAECAQYQAILQKNLMYLAAIADAQQPQGSANSPQFQQVPGSVPQQGNPMQQTQATTLQQQQQLQQQPQQVGVPKLPFQLNGGFPSQEQQQQLLQYQQQQQQQFQGHQGFGAAVNNGMHQLMRPGGIDIRGGKQVALETNSGDGLGKLAPGQGSGGRE